MKVAHFKFDAGLRTLLQCNHKAGAFDYSFRGPQSAKHLIESVGIPHTEIGEVLVDGRSAGAEYLVNDGDSMDVAGIPPGAGILAEPRFILDGHLGKLNAHLRMLGFDCLYRHNYDDATLRDTSVAMARVLLTRDRHLLMQKAITQGYLPRSMDPTQQTREVVRRFGLQRWIRPFLRCIRCNGILAPVPKEQVIGRLEPLTRLYFEDFRICPDCHQLYWRGSHFQQMERIIAELRSID